MRRPELRLPYPLPQQEPVLDSPARYKVLRAGRRWGKTRAAMIAALVGHGDTVDGRRQWNGNLQGGDVIWVGPTRDQAGVIWREEVKPRLQQTGVAVLNETERTATIPGAGTLHLVSAEAIDAKVRGTGRRLAGVILDEAAHFDLEYAWKHVIRAALLDNKGWALFMSTTNAGPDGNTEQRMPSYFNILCETIRDGTMREAGWAAFYGTVFDNPHIDAGEAKAFVDGFEPGTLAYEQEVFANLLKPGAGLALDQMDHATHVAPWPAQAVPEHWSEWGAFDWGYNHPFFFGHFAADEDGNAYLVDSVTGRGQTPEEIVATAKRALPLHRFTMIHAGHDCWHNKGRSIGEDTPTIAEVFAEQQVYLLKANIDLVQGLDLMRRMVRWKDHQGQPTGFPRFRIMNTPTNNQVYQQLSSLQIDPKHPEKPLKRDAVGGRGGDDAADMVRYGLCARYLKGHDPEDAKPFYAGSPEALLSEYEHGRRVSNRFKGPPKLVKEDIPLDDTLGGIY